MDHKFGYVYVFTNPAMPGQVKIGQTQRRPEQRGVELSSATGVPAAFVLFYSRSFEDCALAERLVHSVLAEQGFRTAKNREFFSIAPEAAQELIDKVALSLDNSVARETFSSAFLNEAKEILAKSKPLVSQLEEALTLLEHSSALGDAVAAYLAGETVLELLAKKRGVSGVTEEVMKASARAYFELAGTRGIPRGFACSAKVALSENHLSAYVANWQKYLESLPVDEPVPPDEIEFLLAFMYDNMFETEATRPEVHPYLTQNSRQLCKFTKLHADDIPAEFGEWLQHYTSTLEARLLAKFKVPLILLLLGLVLWFWKPEVLIGGVALLLFFGGLFVSIRGRFRARIEAKEKKKKKAKN